MQSQESKIVHGLIWLVSITLLINVNYILYINSYRFRLGVHLFPFSGAEHSYPLTAPRTELYSIGVVECWF